MNDAPYLLKAESAKKFRETLLASPQVKPLENYLTSVKARCSENYQIPHFDPLDGGIFARALFLLEAPGPQAIKSGFVSRNNPDPTAKNLCNLMQNASIPRSDTLIWNIVPWYVGENGSIRPVTNADIQEALPYLRELLDLLPRLQVIVLVGEKAKSTTKAIQSMTTLPIVPTCHPSARVFNIWPEKKRQTEEAFAAVAKFLQDNTYEREYPMNTSKNLFAILDDLIACWCERRALGPLGRILQVYPLASNLTDEWQFL